MKHTTPSGFRDVLAEEAQEREVIGRRVQDLLAEQGYVPLETPTLESMAVMQLSGHLPATPFKFFDATGDLVTLRPDVTLQVARMCAVRLKDEPGPFRFRYVQRVFRETEAKMRADVREKMQIGIECIGENGPKIDAEVIKLMAQSLEAAGVFDFKLSLATVGVLRALLKASGASQAWSQKILDAFHRSNFVEIDHLTSPAYTNRAYGYDGHGDSAAFRTTPQRSEESICAHAYAQSQAQSQTQSQTQAQSQQDYLSQTFYVAEDSSANKENTGAAAPVFADAIRALAHIRGGRSAIDEVRALVAPLGCEDGLDDLAQTYDLLVDAGLADRILVDFSVMSSFSYYTGIVFEAFSTALGTPLGSGGRYDNMLGAYGTDRPAAGFAFYLEEAQEAAHCAAQEKEKTSSLEGSTHTRPLRIAIPKGALNPEAVRALTDAGLDTEGLDDPGRSLIIRRPNVEYIIVRPSDAPIFVEMGAADCGICGEDSLLEVAANVVELVDLKFGGCRFVVAQPADVAESLEDQYRRLGFLRVATKYPRITQEYFARQGTQVEIVGLRGNIELGPLTGLSECIVDITATGTTLRENNLVAVQDVLDSTARFFANVCSFRTDARIRQLASKLAAQSCDQAVTTTPGGSVKD